ncbi:MAG TPA: DUF1015 domain-containing protein [Candidatus Limnocylindria bacterium]|nr:DUF1015 domain-containing protein [Candidatus Limnocylindria bacterium]
MPLVRPFRGLGYALDRYGGTAIPERVRMPDDGDAHPGRLADLTELVAPPYDVIDEAQRVQLAARDPHNAVHLELAGGEDPHAVAAAALTEWIADGTLTREPEPRFYYYGHARTAAPDEPVVHGILARVLLEPWGAGIRPHEHTMPGPKADRLGLLRATGTQLSPILVTYLDRSERYRHVMSRPWSDEWRARDPDGLLHTLAGVEPDERMTRFLSRQTLFIADGHHRYETALAHQAELRSHPDWTDAPRGALEADWIMCVLVNAELEELEIRPTHRLLLRADPEALRSLVRDPDPIFSALPVPPDELGRALEARGDGEEAIFGLVLPGGEGWLLVADADAADDRMRRERVSGAVRRLDLSLLHAALLDDRLGIGAAEVAGGQHLAYTRSEAEALARVRSGEAQAAILVRPTRLDQLAAVANAGDVMPQKSTYFYPKLLTGMAFMPIGGVEEHPPTVEEDA